ncbi:prephenate dehydrogenase/arogenate dehydrogenase family protein [Gilvimarinus sp. SDUM040013]|uniref:Prephenate dehydrogenase/arogenate dehydrogenase family protein n=1 Tax=Gilvimarinus gilvus TaxID=3058038 RepID=A0ABU4RU33_9GAMM|nr:prephenate dehydrogenase/arogenate dehydrogenase family protein [Gilvimarinus sp. SDUM040013]MDO3385025.1 prephenate dehydrogenase/arogenate dehydrogenase family protein [Gilvimarinus sp. SDUM040013]MDX6848400.1 prephenate dehydrogenase/arogenate dehydrogenase family protein [Gilvimarinus sp. SDUM040013]
MNKLVVIGLGLIGGSVSKGVGERGLARERIGVVRDAETARIAVELGVVDRACLSVDEICGELAADDLVFIAVPTLAVESILAKLKAPIAAGVAVTDGASVKGSVAEAAARVFGSVPPNLVLGHPIAGSEKSGVTAANADLYVDHRVILTPADTTDTLALARVTQLWQKLGAEVINMPIDEHDQVLGATSHLPHAIAYSLVDTLAHDIDNPNIFRYAAGGFRDFTRIASSDPVMWHDIMRANRDSVVASLELFMGNLQRLKTAVESDDGEYLLAMFSRAKQARDLYTQLGEPKLPKSKD